MGAVRCFTTVLQAVEAGHVGGHVGAAQDVVAHDGVLGVGEGHLPHLRPRPLKQVGNTTPLIHRLLGQARGVVLLVQHTHTHTRVRVHLVSNTAEGFTAVTLNFQKQGRFETILLENKSLRRRLEMPPYSVNWDGNAAVSLLVGGVTHVSAQPDQDLHTSQLNGFHFTV